MLMMSMSASPIGLDLNWRSGLAERENSTTTFGAITDRGDRSTLSNANIKHQQTTAGLIDCLNLKQSQKQRNSFCRDIPPSRGADCYQSQMPAIKNWSLYRKPLARLNFLKCQSG
ncbi:hypothetical protein C660_08539 [Alcaligenes sp. HPC1271]|nr:hypothetical protein C660_08539 [Alcaligenes sp. HPC1271]